MVETMDSGEPLEELELLQFRLGERTFAVESRYVLEVHRPTTLTPLPGVPAHVRGVMIHQRRVIGVIDLSKFLGLPTVLAEHVLLLKHDRLEAGVLVSRIDGFVRSGQDEVRVLNAASLLTEAAL